jgi:hypothetical protein
VVSATAVPRKSPATSFRVIDGQAVVMQAEGAEVHILNDVGTRVWSLLDGKRTVDEIVAMVEGQLRSDGGYDQLPADVGADVTDFLDDIVKRGMIEFNEEKG